MTIPTAYRDNNQIVIVYKNSIVILPEELNVYTYDIIKNFHYYFSAVVPEIRNDFFVADYSKISNHHIVGFDLFDILCPSLPDPYVTIKQYQDFAKIKPGDIVLDLGAYSGLCSISFALIVGQQGKVIAVEPDNINYQCCLENINRFNNKLNMNNIDLIHGAVWHVSEELLFSGEGCLGSHVISNRSENRKSLEKIKGFTLYDLTKHLHKVDFIKCDIEGAEQDIFKDTLFFQKFRPKIIIEPHYIDNVLNITKCRDVLIEYNYSFNEIKQIGVSIPLLECIPNE